MVYPLNQQIESLMESCIDPETGELLPEANEESVQEALEQMQIDFDEKIKALRNSYLTVKMNAECIAAEASALWKIQQEKSKQAKTEENKAERIKRFIAWLLQGEKFDKDGVKIGYRRSEETVIEDGFIDWAIQNAPELLNTPQVRKADVKAAIKSGEDIEFAHIEQKTNIQVK